MDEEILFWIKALKCPICLKGGGGTLVYVYAGQHVKCQSCGVLYSMSENIINMMAPSIMSKSSVNVQKFWEEDFKRRFQYGDIDLERFNELLDSFAEGLHDKEHLVVREINIENIKDKKILEIGSGSGAHAAFLKKSGAHILAMDISNERVIATGKKLALIEQGKGVSMQGDAQRLPFEANTFDIVYSSGVLHHAPNTEACIKEVYRVLRHGGSAVIMLYARWALSTLLYIYGKGILSGLIFKYPEEKWMGYVTEGGPVGKDITNPYTRVYSKKQIMELFSEFQEIRIRQSGFRFFDIPKVGKYVYTIFRKIHKLKEFEGGRLSSGISWKQMAPAEKLIGRYLGNCLNIRAIK